MEFCAHCRVFYQKGGRLMVEKAIIRVLRLLSMLLFVAMIIIVFAQVMLRYFLNAPLAWSDELSRILLGWMAFFGVTLVHFSEAGHPAVTFLKEKLPGKGKAVAKLAIDAILSLGFVVVFFASCRYTIENHRFVTAVLHLPNSYKYAVLPISMLLMAYKSIKDTIFDLKDFVKTSKESGCDK